MRIPHERVQNWANNVRASLWFLPSTFVILATLLSWAVPTIQTTPAEYATPIRKIMFSGSPDAARTVLSVISGSTITVISLLFSITIVALQQASTQFSPRIMRNFTRDRGNQVVLGVYLATFIYSLLLLGQIRGDDASGDAQVPGLAVTVSIALAALCLGLLVYFIHHGATLFQASNIIESIHRELRQQIDQFYPSRVGDPEEEEDDDVDRVYMRSNDHSPIVVRAVSSGYLRSVDTTALTDAVGNGRWAAIHPFIGTYITEGDLLAEVDRSDQPESELIEAVRNVFVLDRERTMYQDPLFGIRQLVDIAVKALSPSINDPTTAEHALSCIGDTVVSIANRSFPRKLRIVERDGRDPVHLWMNRPSFEDVIDVAFSQIRRAGRDHVHVTLHVLKVLGAAGSQARGLRVEAFRRQIDDIAWFVDEGQFAPHERAVLRECIESTRRQVAVDAPAGVPLNSR